MSCVQNGTVTATVNAAKALVIYATVSAHAI